MRTLLPPPPPSSPDHSPALASLAARILYLNPLPSTTTNLPLYVLNAAAFPSANDINHDDLVPYVLARLPNEDSLIAGLEYEILFFAKNIQGDEKKKRPGWQWYIQTYQLLSRVVRKRIRKLWVVGAEKWLRMLVEGVLVMGGEKGRRKVLFAKGWRELSGWGLKIEECCVPPTAWEAELKNGRNKSLGVGEETEKASKRAFGVTRPLPFPVGCGNATGDDQPEPRLPRVLREATSFLLTDDCIKTKGIFRVNAKAVHVEALKDAYDRGQQFTIWAEGSTMLSFPYWREGAGEIIVDELEKKDGFDAHAAAGLIKLWYKELKEPICPPSCYQALRKFYGDESLQLQPESLADMLKSNADWTFLSPIAKQILRLHLLPMLSKVTDFKEWNQMAAHNLAICFAPTLLRGSDIEEDMKITGIVTRLLGALIENWKTHLAPALDPEGHFYERLRLPEAIGDREDPLEESDPVALSLGSQMNGITLIDNDGSGSETPHDDLDDADARPALPFRTRTLVDADDSRHLPPLPPRPRTFSDAEDQRPPLPPRIRSSTIANIPTFSHPSTPWSSGQSSPANGSDHQVKRKPAPTIQPSPRYSTIMGPAPQPNSTLEHVPLYNTVEQSEEEPYGPEPDPELPGYEAVPGPTSRTTIPRKPVPNTSPERKA
ncbi:MAG: hypothetical protein Q9174_000470 [Haloplaca sp. 1 TL-2023]